MVVAVLDADVLIGFLSSTDVHHAAAVELIRRSMANGERRVISAVNYAEILVGPARAGVGAVQRVDIMLHRFGIQVADADASMARAAAAIRAQNPEIKLPDAFVLAIARRERASGADVRVESFDERLLKAVVARLTD